MPDGEPLRYENWRRRIWLPAVEAAALGTLTFHDLRRACASGMVADRVDMKTAQTRLGHSDPRLTLAVYAQAMSDSDRGAADRLGDRFMPSARVCEGVTARAGTAASTECTKPTEIHRPNCRTVAWCTSDRSPVRDGACCDPRLGDPRL